MAEGAKVLVIDDDPDFIQYVEMILERHGYRVLAASDGRTGLSLARSERPAVVLVDLLMSPDDGFVVCEQLRECPELQGVALIVVSAIRRKLHKTIASPDVGAKLDADAYIDKPFDPETLVRTVDEMVHLTASRASARREQP